MVNFLPRRRAPLAPVSVQWLIGARREWKCKDPIGRGAAWESHSSLSPWLLRARRSSSCGLTRPEREACCPVLTEAAARHSLHKELCKSLPGAGGGEGWAPRALSHSCILRDFKQCTFTKMLSLFKVAFACQLLNHIQPSRGKSRLSCSPFMDEGYW